MDLADPFLRLARDEFGEVEGIGDADEFVGEVALYEEYPF